MPRKPPRRTRERIPELSLRRFNGFGEPNVNTTLIAQEMNISPGNLYYHFRNKEDILHQLFSQFEREIDRLLATPGEARSPNVEDAWLFLHLLFELIWKDRFIYRDLNHLLTNSRVFELRFRALLAQKVQVARWLIEGLQRRAELRASDAEVQALATNMVVVATYWLSYEYVLNPRQLADAQHAAAAVARGCYQVMALAAPYLQGQARQLFARLAGAYVS